MFSLYNGFKMYTSVFGYKYVSMIIAVTIFKSHMR